MKNKLLKLFLTISLLITLAVLMAVSVSAEGSEVHVGVDDHNNKKIGFTYLGDGVYRVYDNSFCTNLGMCGEFTDFHPDMYYEGTDWNQAGWVTSPTHDPKDAGNPNMYVSKVYAVESTFDPDDYEILVFKDTDMVTIVDFGCGEYNGENTFYVDLIFNRAGTYYGEKNNGHQGQLQFFADIWIYSDLGYTKVEHMGKSEIVNWQDKTIIEPAGAAYYVSCYGKQNTNGVFDVGGFNKSYCAPKTGGLYLINEEVRFTVTPKAGQDYYGFTLTREKDGTAIAYQYDKTTGEYYFVSDGYNFVITAKEQFDITYMVGQEKITIDGAPTGIKKGENKTVSTYLPASSYAQNGKQFVGWYTSDDILVTTINGSVLTEDVVLYAKYRYTDVTLQIVSAGGYNKPDENTTKYMVAFGAIYSCSSSYTIDNFGIYVNSSNAFKATDSFKNVYTADKTKFAENGYKYYTYIYDVGTSTTYYAKAYVVIDGDYYFTDVAQANGNDTTEFTLD